MDETNHPTNPPPNHLGNPGPGHETADVNIWAIGKFAIGLIVVCLISITMLLGLVKFFQSREDTSVANTVNPGKLFPQPQLEITPVLDLKAVRAEEDKLLNSYGWVDPQKGLVRIPIDQAIDVLAKRGLPSRAPSAAPADAREVSTPSESGLGIAPPAEGQSK